jgi:carboxypeptidase C (cathepsin A)
MNKNFPNFRMMVYYGDVDSVCSNAYSKWLFDLDFKYLENELWNIWSVDGQTSGFITQFKTSLDSKEIPNRFTYATVHDAGHEVPAYKPKESFILFQAFINANFNI